MKKILIIIISLFFIPLSIYAKDDFYIEDIEINNYELSPKFDKYNNNYSVLVDKEINSLEINCKYDEEKYELKIVNNENLNDNKTIYLTLINKENLEKNNYTINVRFIKEEKVFDEVIKDPFEEQKEKNYAPLICIICFSLIVFIFYILFLRKKSYVL